MRNKGKFEYVDEFRKISTLEKLIPIDNLFIDVNDQNKVENNKFIRYREEPNLQEIVVKKTPNAIFLENQVIENYRVDYENQCKQEYQFALEDVTTEIDYYKQWSQDLNKEVKQRTYEHKFYFKNANPPPRLHQDTLSNNAYKTTLMGAATQNKAVNKNKDVLSTSNLHENAIEQENQIEFPKRSKYNFQEINKYLYQRDENEYKYEENNNFQDEKIKKQINEYKKLKNLDVIDKIGQFDEEYDKFQYYMELPEDKCEIPFINNSIINENYNLTIDYFRDLGAPSRDILNFVVDLYEKPMKEREKNKVEVEDDDSYNQEKRQMLYLYYLKPEELKVNKSQMNFYDIANISMGRITSLNSSMCVRNQKITRAQYNKLLNKLEKYDMKETQGGKSMNHKKIATDDLEDQNNFHQKHKEENPDEQDNKDIEDIEKLIDDINDLRKEVQKMESQDNQNKINIKHFNEEVYAKLQFLLNKLYDIVLEKSTIKYKLSQISEHIQEIQGVNDLGYDRVRILWFIVKIYQQILKKKNKTVNLRNILSQDGKADPQNVKYKNQKIVAVQPINARKVYGFNNTGQKANRNAKSKTPTKGSNKAAGQTTVKGFYQNGKFSNSYNKNLTTKK